MANKKLTSKTVAQLAGMVLAGKYDNHDRIDLLPVLYALAGSCLTQAPDKKKVVKVKKK